MFTKLEIENYKNIKKIELDNLKQINIIVGKNETGKTTILETIYLMIAPSKPDLAVKVNSFRNLDQINDKYWPLFFNDLSLDNSINLKVIVKNPNEIRNLTIKPYYETSDDINTIDSSNVSFQTSETGITYPIKGLNLEYHLKKEDIQEKILSSIFIEGKKVVKKRKPDDHEEPINGVFINSFTMRLGDTPQRLGEILIKKETKKIIKVLKRIEPSLQDIVLIDKGLIYCDVGLKNMIPVASLGAGFLKIFAIILALSQIQNGVIIIDEIDNGLHNTSLSILWEAIFTFANENNSQIFATTHSYECIKLLINNPKFNKFKQRIKLFRIEKKDEKSKIIDYNYDELENTIEQNWEFR